MYGRRVGGVPPLHGHAPSRGTDDVNELPLPSIDEAERWVEQHLDGLYTGNARRSGAFIGGQTSANAALERLDIDGYAKRRSAVWPPDTRGATKLSPYIRHGLIDLPTVHDHPNVATAGSYDQFRFRGELLWQDYSRQWYAAFGSQTREGVVSAPQPGKSAADWTHEPWWREMRCVDQTLTELHEDGWMVNQTRMWLASQWSVRAGADWREGDDEMFRHLLDGSRAANRQGWQWVVGGTRGRSYGFAKRQVTKRAPQFCADCALSDKCPIGAYPGSVSAPATMGPTMSVDRFGPLAGASSTLFDHDDAAENDGPQPTAVWLTAESLGDDDPALRAHPTLPAPFFLEEPLLERLRLDGKRLVFLTECLADLACRRELHIWRGRPSEFLSPDGPVAPDKLIAVTHAPVPGFERLIENVTSALVFEPWPWLRPPTPALLERLGGKRFPSFKDWCRLTKP